MKRVLLIAVLLAGCGEVSKDVDTASWDLWINHGLPGGCHGSLTAALGETITGTWQCGETGNVTGQTNGADLMLFLEPTYSVSAVVRDYDGAIIGTTADGGPVVGYRQ